MATHIFYNTPAHPLPDPAKLSGQYSAAARKGLRTDDLRRRLTAAKIGRLIAHALDVAGVELADDDVDRLNVVLRGGRA